MLQIRYPAGRDPEWRYILHVVFDEYFRIPYEATATYSDSVEIGLAGDAEHRTLRIASELLNVPDARWLAAASLSQGPLVWTTPANDLPLLRGFHESLPVLYGKCTTAGRYFEANNHSVAIGLDILGTAFFMLTRYEELIPTERDSYGRFPSSSILSVREGFHRRPVVQEYLEILWTCMRFLWPGLTRSQRVYKVVLTHDVDSPTSRSWPSVSVVKHVLADLTLRREPKLALRRGAGLLYDRCSGAPPSWDVLNTFAFLMDTGEQFGLTTTFNFLPYRSAAYNDSTYAVADPPVRALLREIYRRGHTVGYHASFKGFEDPATLQQEIRELRRVTSEEGITQAEWGGRHHFLKWKNPDTWQAWEDAGMQYDSSLGFNDEVGFRCGCCFEFPVFNLITRRMLRLREQPLIFMDVALTENRRLPAASVAEAMQTVNKACRRYGGDLVVLWHNTSVVGQAEKKMYLDLVSTIV